MCFTDCILGILNRQKTLKREHKNPLKNCRKITTKQVMELNKTIKEMEVDTIKKTQSEATLEIETLGKISGNIDVSISNRIQEMEERISGTEDSIENTGTTIKENKKMQKDPNSKHPGNPGHNEKTKPTDNRSR
jgi:malonyl CoA-acyl carrier protein transacylase